MDSKIPTLIINKGQDLVRQLVPQVIDIAVQTGIQNIGTPNVQLPDTCLISDELQRILNLRNTLIDKLNTTVNIIERLSKPLDTLVPTVNTLSTSLQVTDTARIVANTAMAFIPPAILPGAVPAAINNLKDLIEFVGPKITNTKNIITSIQAALDYVNSILKKLIDIFKSIDQYLTNCGAVSETTPLTSLNPYLQQLDQQQQEVQTASINQIYRGFVLEVREEQFSHTVSRRRAVALNP